MPRAAAADNRKATEAMIAKPIAGHAGLVEALRQRAVDLGISRLEIDRIAGFVEGYSGRLLGNADNSTHPRRMWAKSFEDILETLGLRVFLIVDEAATARTLARREPVRSHNQRFGNLSRLKAAPKLPAPDPKAAAGPDAVDVRRGVSKYG